MTTDIVRDALTHAARGAHHPACPVNAAEETPAEYGYRLGFESGYVEALPSPPAEYAQGLDPYSRGYVAGNASNGVGLSAELVAARAALALAAGETFGGAS